LLIRGWIGKLALVESVLVSTDWSMAISMAAGSYPIPVSGFMTAIPVATIIWLAAIFLILGLATRLGAIVLCSLAVASHVHVATLDLNLFWIATLASYVLSGAGPLSLDRALSQGLKNAALPLGSPAYSGLRLDPAGPYIFVPPRTAPLANAHARREWRLRVKSRCHDRAPRRMAPHEIGISTVWQQCYRFGVAHR